MSNVGLRIYTKIERPSRDLVEQFRDLPTPNIADNMGRFSCVDSQIRPFNKAKLLGTAFTVKSRTADNLMFHKALDLAKPGDIIVVDVQGDMINAVTGEIMMRYAKKKGISGFLIDGAIRDSGALKNLDFSVYAKGSNPKGPYKDGPGEINVPVSCGGVVVHPGDIVVGDEDGVVIISSKDAEDVLKKTKETFDKEASIFEAIENGTWDRSWVDETLAEKGCEFIDE
ncbi:RraA family protein [Anaerobacillus isosaccharinicus]|uniref:Putative 4-hydroxy-4-methyl-2-oxoglutarate aldolase n=1 Tax=Anaerobacillus isosaccharinicus TaxID=1532552 RepID=A0A1S2KVT8_9BACI|nr:RraA family protein [Anaerobacillus isosaccharinicus]MBA5588304.1 RraA family protein [Anaerobacillus isosaccharinicus]QOY38259.1 RraA family protein [Anaerobacillus isosaccharinicus]